MKRLVLTLGLCISLVGCAGGNPPATDEPTPAITTMPTAQQSEAPSASPTAAPTASATPDATATATSAPTAPPTASPAALPEGITAHPAGTDGNDEGLLSYLPPGYEDDDSDWPLLVYLHGNLETGDGSEAQLRNVLSGPLGNTDACPNTCLGIPQLIAAGDWPSEQPFVVLMPQYSDFDAGHCELGDEIQSVIDWADATYRIDPARIYLTGVSCGAIGVLDYMAMSQERRVAAALPISSAPFEGAHEGARVRGGCAIANTPTWFFHGAADRTVPVHYAEDAVAELNACTDPPPNEIKLTIYPDADHSDVWTHTYDGSAGHDIYSWLLDHRLNSPD